jgi:hypothetical protein
MVNWNFSQQKKRFFSNFLLAELSVDQLVNLRRREALAYEIDVFQQAAKDKQSNIKHQERLDLHLRQLRRLITHVKITCEASTVKIWSFLFCMIVKYIVQSCFV